VTDNNYDILIIGGGINGACIARDAAGRGLSVVLCEMGDLGGATSSASSKLIHGGLRYLEHYAFRLVGEALRERQILLQSAPHIVWPMQFVLPHAPSLRPTWMIRIGLWLYDRLGGAHKLARSGKVDLTAPAYGAALAPNFKTGFIYSDCWVDDARFVVLSALDAAAKGADIRPRTRCTSARRVGDRWQATLEGPDGSQEVTARVLVNAGGPWVQQVISEVAGGNAPAQVRLIKGSHIVVPRLYDGPHAFILQNDDNRVIFVIPYEGEFSLIGTTDVPVDGKPGPVEISDAETDYLCLAVNRYFRAAISPTDVVWSYAGVRPLYDDGENDPSAVTRDYVLALDAPDEAPPMLSIFGGKITTARKLAEQAMAKLGPFFPGLPPGWTAGAALPGGNFGAFDDFARALRQEYPGLDGGWLDGLAHRHGTRARTILDGAASEAELGVSFGGGLYQVEVDWLCREEWAAMPEDVLWRRTKTGLHMTPDQRKSVADYIARMRSG